MENKVKKKGRPRKDKFPFLLSTDATLAKYNILDYDGMDFTFRKDTHRRYKANRILGTMMDYINRVLIPNMLILVDNGIYVNKDDYRTAIDYAMRTGKSADSVSNWEKYIADRRDWFELDAEDKFNIYVLHLTRKGRILPRRLWYNLYRYLGRARKKKWPWVFKLKKYKYLRSPSLNKLINAYAKENIGTTESILTMSNSRLKEVYGVSDRVISQFHRYLKTRKEKGTDSFLKQTR